MISKHSPLKFKTMTIELIILYEAYQCRFLAIKTEEENDNSNLMTSSHYPLNFLIGAFRFSFFQVKVLTEPLRSSGRFIR